MNVSYNKAIYAGYLVKKPELRYTTTHVPVATGTVAVNSKYRDKETVLFMDFRVFGKAAEILEQYGEKGSPLLIEGETRYESWEHEGAKYHRTYTFCTAFRFLGKKAEETTDTPEVAVSGGEEDGDIPF